MPASVGYYVPTADATSQTACPTGQTTAGTGSTSVSACFTPAPFTCSGENYDVNDNTADGCELTQPLAAHTQGTASDLGSKSCFDGSSDTTVNGVLYSDSRVHTAPAITGFDSTVGSAPEWYSVTATGGFACVNDYSVTFTTTGGGATACYRLTISTELTTNSVLVSGSGTQTMSGGSGSYTDGSTVYFKVEKTCSLPIQEAIAYTIHFHL